MAQAAEMAQEAIMANQGQCCCAASKTFVHEDIYDEFVAKSKEFAEKRVCGDPFGADVQHGPQVCDSCNTLRVAIICKTNAMVLSPTICC